MFLTESKRRDVRRNIIGAQQLMAGGKKESDSIAEELKNPKRDYVTDYKNGKLNSHLMTPVVSLYLYMGFQEEYIEKYLNEVEKIYRELMDEDVC